MYPVYVRECSRAEIWSCLFNDLYLSILHHGTHIRRYHCSCNICYTILVYIRINICMRKYFYIKLSSGGIIYNGRDRALIGEFFNPVVAVCSIRMENIPYCSDTLINGESCG